MTRTASFLKHNAIALCALFIALGGTSYAAVAIPRNSVGPRQLRKGAVTATKIHSGAISPGKLSSKAFGARILYFAEIENNGVVAASDPRGVKTQGWTYTSGGGLVDFPRALPKDCFSVAAATTSESGNGAPISIGAAIQNEHLVEVHVNPGTQLALLILCPR